MLKHPIKHDKRKPIKPIYCINVHKNNPTTQTNNDRQTYITSSPQSILKNSQQHVVQNLHNNDWTVVIYYNSHNPPTMLVGSYYIFHWVLTVLAGFWHLTFCSDCAHWFWIFNCVLTMFAAFQHFLLLFYSTCRILTCQILFRHHFLAFNILHCALTVVTELTFHTVSWHTLTHCVRTVCTALGISYSPLAELAWFWLVHVLTETHFNICHSVLAVLAKSEHLCVTAVLIRCNVSQQSVNKDRLVGLMVKASASWVEGPEFESHLRRYVFGVESYQWLKNWHSSGYPARHLAL